MSAWNKGGPFAKPASQSRDTLASTAASAPSTAQHAHSNSLSRIRQMNREKSFSGLPASFASQGQGTTGSPVHSPSVEQSGFGLGGSVASLGGAITSGLHPLRAPWCIWYMHRSPGSKIKDYDLAMKRIGAFSSVEDFWALYVRLKPLDELASVSDLHLFRAGIKPTYEDPANICGGKWQIRLRKGIAARLWETLILAIIGDQFHGPLSEGVAPDELCGAVISMRQHEDVLSVWNRTSGDGFATLRIRSVLREVLELGPDVNFEYVQHSDRLGKV